MTDNIVAFKGVKQTNIRKCDNKNKLSGLELISQKMIIMN